jgi:hypothetical protein
MKKKILNEEQVAEAIRLYVEEKMGTPSIGKAFDVDKRVINRTLRENGVVLDQPGRRNIGGRKAAQKRYESKNKKQRSDYHKEWSKDNRDSLRTYHSVWRDDNREHVKKYGRDYEKKRRAEDPKYRLAARTRTAVWTCLKERNVAKYRSTFDLLGYTLEELMKHLEGLFTEGMTWDNYGEWHVDHKIPMVKFNFTSVEDNEFKICWAIENLQPLWGPDNLSKGSKYL